MLFVVMWLNSLDRAFYCVDSVFGCVDELDTSNFMSIISKFLGLGFIFEQVTPAKQYTTKAKNACLGQISKRMSLLLVGVRATKQFFRVSIRFAKLRKLFIFCAISLPCSQL